MSSGISGPTIAGVNEALDLLTTTIGAILVRGNSGWVAIEPGPEGYVLTSHGPNELPTYEPPA